MTYFITIEELKQTTFNANLDNEYIAPALEEAQSIYLREIIGDLLYNSITNKIDSETLSGKYLTLVNQYIKPYLTYKVQSVIVIPLNNKTRNAGIINQYDQGFNTSTMKDTAYLADYYNSRAEFYANRLTTYLQKNATDFPEYGYSDDNITQPNESQNVTTLFLGGRKKKGCGCTVTPQSTVNTVEWNNVQNKPDFADVATSGDYEDLENKPEINNATLTIKQGGVVKGTFSANASENVEINLQSGGSGGSTDWSDITNKPDFATVATSGDYDDLENKPTIPVVPTNVSAFTNDAGYTTFDGDYNSLTNKPTIPTVPTNVSAFTNDAGYLTQHQSLAGYATETWVQEQGFSTFSGSYNDLNNKPDLTHYVEDTDLAQVATSGDYNDLKNKPVIPTVNNATLTITQGGATKGTFTANAGTDVTIDLEAGGSGSTDWNDIQNKPDFATVATSGSYNDLRDIPNYFSYIQENGSHNGVTLNGETQFGEITADIAGGIQCNFKVDKSVSTRLYTDYIITGENTAGRNELVISGDDGNNVYGKIAKDGIYEGNTKLENKYLQINDLPANVSAFTNDAGYLTQHQSLDGYATETWVQEQGFSTFSGSYNDLTDKPSIPTVNNAVMTIKQGGVARGTFSANANENVEINLDAGGAAQVQADWNEADTTAVDYIKNKPTIPVVPTNVSAFTNDAGYTTFSGDYNDLTNKPTIPTVPTNVSAFTNDAGYTTFDGDYNSLTNKPSIPAAQVQTDWNANSGMGQLLNKPSMATETWTFTLSDNSTVTKTVWLQPTV